MKFIKLVLLKINIFIHWVCSPLLLPFCLLCRLLPQKLDIGLGPLPMINNVYFAKALRLYHYTAETFATNPYFITSEFDVLFSTGFRRIFYYVPALSFMRCVLRYRCVYVYFNGGPLSPIPVLRLLEPMLFRMAGVKTVVMPYGSDCQIFDRTPNKLMANALCNDYPAFFQKDHKRVIRQVESWSKGANIVIGAMDSVDYLFFWNRIRFCHFAIDTGAFTPQYPSVHQKQPVKILHAPNHTAIKGTDAIMRAIDTLKNEGYEIELIFRQGVPNHEFLEIIKEADIVIDQLIIGCYAMFAMEAMSFGKPVICYLRDDLVETFVNAGCVEKDDIPLISAQPHTIADVLRGLLDAPETLISIGQKSRAYVEKYHSLDAMGAFYDEINRSLGIFSK